MIIFLKSGDKMGIETNETTERDFLNQASSGLNDMIDSKKFEGNWEFQLDSWLRDIVDICCYFRGMASHVEIQTVLRTGSCGKPEIVFTSEKVMEVRK